MANTLVAYFSRADENYFNGKLEYIDIGNTQKLAEIIVSKTNADVFKIEMEKPYSKKYQKCIDEAKADQKQNARPKLIAMPESIEKYDTIYLGFPNYWGTMPMAVFTFLESFDFSNKIIKPFCTHEGSGMGRSQIDLKNIVPTAKIENSIAIHGSEVDNAKEEILNWIK